MDARNEHVFLSDRWHTLHYCRPEAGCRNWSATQSFNRMNLRGSATAFVTLGHKLDKSYMHHLLYPSKPEGSNVDNTTCRLKEVW